MAEKQPSKSERKRERQPISVPFIWEERPGTPKKDWKPTVQTFKPAVPPAKLVVSVPFGWEEKPGTPLPSFLQPQKESVFFSSPPKYSDQDSGNWSSSNGGNDDQDYNGGDDDSELDIRSIETDDSFTSAKSLLANGLISTSALSNAVPIGQTSAALTSTYSGQLAGPGSPDSETESNASSCAVETTSLAGASFLEWLFPLLVRSSSFRNKVGRLEKDPSQKAEGKEFLHENNGSQIRRPLLTLGELIVMSRRRSCQRKVIKMHKQPSMVHILPAFFFLLIDSNLMSENSYLITTYIVDLMNNRTL